MINHDIQTYMRGSRNESQIQGLKELLSNCDHCAIGVEIGAYAGQSTEIFLRSGKFDRLISIDPFLDGYDPKDPGAILFPMDLVRYNFYCRIIQFPNVLHLNLSSTEASTLFDKNYIDFLYIDGDHRYEHVKNDIDNFLPKMKMHGIIAGHDYNVYEGVNRAVTERFRKPSFIFRDSSWMVKL